MRLNLDDTGGARELAFHRIKAAREDLESVQLNFENGKYRTSNNRAYYTIFTNQRIVCGIFVFYRIFKKGWGAQRRAYNLHHNDSAK